MYLKKFSFILVFSFLIGLLTAYYNRIEGRIIVYPKLKNNIVYRDDDDNIYSYVVKKI